MEFIAAIDIFEVVPNQTPRPLEPWRNQAWHNIVERWETLGFLPITETIEPPHGTLTIEVSCNFSRWLYSIDISDIDFDPDAHNSNLKIRLNSTRIYDLLKCIARHRFIDVRMVQNHGQASFTALNCTLNDVNFIPDTHAFELDLHSYDCSFRSF